MDLIKTRVKPIETAADSTSIFMRVPFNIDDPAAIENMTLQMKFDDGFVAYINGTEVARNNLREDGEQSFDSRALPHRTSSALEFKNFVISEHVDKLVAGENILAIHGMNSSASI